MRLRIVTSIRLCSTPTYCSTLKAIDIQHGVLEDSTRIIHSNRLQIQITGTSTKWIPSNAHPCRIAHRHHSWLTKKIKNGTLLLHTQCFQEEGIVQEVVEHEDELSHFAGAFGDKDDIKISLATMMNSRSHRTYFLVKVQKCSSSYVGDFGELGAILV